jgi:hypothetical protein
MKEEALMKLLIKDRLVIGNLYPAQGNILQQTLIRDISKKVEVTQDEMKQIKLVPIEGAQGMKWDPEEAGKLGDRDVEFTAAELNLLKEQVNKLDRENKITQGLLDLCLKIKEEKSDGKEKAN